MSAIGIFDSGVGGLTVLRALRTAFPHESFLYLGDSARLPYGTKSAATIQRYLEQNIGFLCGFSVKALIVACNSASSVVDCDHWNRIPLYDVIRPGAEAAARVTKRLRVAVLGTRATVDSGAYTRQLHAINPEIAVFAQPCPLLVPLVEEGWDCHPVTRTILAEYLEKPIAHGADTLILGCTHYPVLKRQIRELVGPDIQLIDSAEVLVERLGTDLRGGRVARETGDGDIDIWMTDNARQFQRIGEMILDPIQVNGWNHADLDPPGGT